MKNTQKGFVLPAIIIFLVLVIAGGVYIYIQTQAAVPKDTMTNTVVTKTTVKAPSFDKFGFSINLPANWLLDVQTYKDQKSFKFTFMPDNNRNLWHGFGITVYDYAPTIEKWIEKNASEYKNGLTVTKEDNFAGKESYYVCDKSKDACDSPIMGFNATVILGNEYSYTLDAAFQDSTYDYSRIVKEIYPNITIK